MRYLKLSRNNSIIIFRHLSGAIIYEKSKQYDYVIGICKQAVKYYSERGVDTEEFEKRLIKLKEKTK
ncbi:hypothetical protein GCM10026983_23960 [Gracilibacillus alcaliphilus]